MRKLGGRSSCKKLEGRQRRRVQLRREMDGVTVKRWRLWENLLIINWGFQGPPKKS